MELPYGVRRFARRHGDQSCRVTMDYAMTIGMTTQDVLAYVTWLGINLATIVGAGLAGFVVQWIVFRILRTFARRTAATFDELILSRTAGPSRWLMILAGMWLSLSLVTLPEGFTAFLTHLISVTFVVLTAWLLIRIIGVARELFLRRYSITVADNLRARAVHTQIRVFERILIAVVVVIAFGCILMTFNGVRQLGVSLLASAGIVGIVVGLAAQKVLGTFLAGLQLAITQPIRLDDVVIVENEWGVIEEITLTYVVVKIWDLRRLVVPMSYFMDKPFQNWTRTSSDLLGTVFLYLDPSAPVEPIRNELHRMLKECKEWDGVVWGLQVTNNSERTMELRALMGSHNASEGWNLRCKVREQLLAFIREKFPDALPKYRLVEHVPPTAEAADPSEPLAPPPTTPEFNPAPAPA